MNLLDFMRKDRGVGLRFEDHLKEKLKLISKYPERYSKRKGDFRETKMKCFPFIIIYKYYKAKNLILITSIFHTRRNSNISIVNKFSKCASLKSRTLEEEMIKDLK